MLWFWVRDWILWVANFRFPFYEVCVQNQWWHLLRPSWGLRHRRSKFNTVRMEYLRAFQYWYCELCLFFNTDIVNFVCFSILILWTLFVFQYWYSEVCLENQWGRKHYLLIFFLWRCLPLRWMRGRGMGQKVLFETSCNRIFFQPVFFTFKSNLT